MTSDERQAPLPAGSHSTNDNDGAASPDRLDRYWDAVTGNGYQRVESIALDPARARTVDLLQTHARTDTARIPDDARARIWRETVAAAGIPIQQEPPMTPSALPESDLATPGLTLPASTSPGRRHPVHPGGPVFPSGRGSVPSGGGPSQPTGRAWWPRLQFGVAAVLILGLFATILAPMDDGRVGLFGGIGNDATPTAEAARGPINVVLPSTNRGHTVTFDRLTIPASQRLVLDPGSFSIVTAESGSLSIAEVGMGLAYINPGGMIPISLDGGHITALEDGPATIRLVTISAIGTTDQAIPDGIVRERLSVFDTTTFAGQSEAEGLLTSATTSSYYAQFALPSTFGPNPPQTGATQAFVHVESGTTQINSPGRQARSIPAGLASPGDFAVDIDLAAGDAAIVGDATTANFRTVPGGEDGTVTALVLAPTLQATPQVISNTATPSVDPSPGRSGQFSLEIEPYTTEGIVALERVTIEPGVSWVVPDGSPMTAVWVAGSATQSQDGATFRTETNPLRYPDVVTLEPGMTIEALSPESVILDRAVFYPSRTPMPATTAGVTIAPLGQAPINNIANAAAIDVHLREGVTGSDPQSPFIIPDDVITDQATGVFTVHSGTLDAATTGSRIQPSSTGAQVSAARVLAGESVSAYGLDGITVATASGETTPATFVSAYATVQFAGTAATPGAVPTNPTALLDTTADPSDANPFLVSIEQHVMGPDASYLFRFGDAPGGRIVTWVANGSATLTMGGQHPVKISAGSPGTAVSDLAVTGDLRVLPGSEGATLYHIQIGIPFPLNGTGGAEGTGTLAISFLGNWADSGYDAPMVFTSGTGANAHITLTLGSTGPGLTRFDVGTGGALVAPINGPVHITSDGGPVNLGGLVTTDPLERGQPLNMDILPGQNVNSSPGGTFTVDVSGTPADYLALQISPTDATAAATPVADVVSSVNDPAAYTGGGGVLDIPASDDGHLVSIERLRISAGARQDLPAGASYLLQSLRGDFTVEQTGVPESVSVTDSSVVDVGLGGGAIVAGDDGIVVTVLSISPLQDRPFWLFAVGGSAPLTLYETTDLIGMVQANVTLGRGPVPAEPEPIPPLGTDAAPEGLTESATILLFAAEGNATTFTSTGPLLENVGQGTTPSEPVATLTIESGNTVVVRNPAAATIQQAQPDEPSLYTSVFIAPLAPEEIDATPVTGTPAAATPSAGRPVAEAVRLACNVTPRTIEELLALYDEGVASPVDPFSLSHRDDQGTGTPADQATVAAITDTLRRQAACQRMGDPLGQYALYSDAYLRVVLPIGYDTRDQLARLTEQPPTQGSGATITGVSVSDVELFVDGRVGGRVALDHEFAYVTFTRAADGTWLMDLFDDRDEPGA